MKLKIYLVSTVLVVLVGCQNSRIIVPQEEVILSPLGIYVTNTSQKFWLAILQGGRYYICSPKNCVSQSYQRLPVDYGVILEGFYLTEHGAIIERLSHGLVKDDSFYEKMKSVRMQLSRPNDLAFNIKDCMGISCVGIGHVRNGVKFYRVESFDEFWLPNTNNKSSVNNVPKGGSDGG